MKSFIEPEDQWCITQNSLAADVSKHYEGLFTQGSGYLHIRGSYEEGLTAAPQGEHYMRLPANVTVEQPRHPRSKTGTYLPGITGNHPLLHEEMVNLPNPLPIVPFVGKERLDMDTSQISQFKRWLDLRDAVLYRSFDWAVAGTVVHCSYYRYVSHATEGLIVQQASFKADREVELSLQMFFDCNVTTNGYDHFASVQHLSGNDWFGVEIETDNHDKVAMASVVSGANLKAEEHGATSTVKLAQGQIVTVQRLTLVSSSRDFDGIMSFATMLQLLATYKGKQSQIYSEHSAKWASIWKTGKIAIEGDDCAQQAVNLSLYHMLRAINPNDNRVAICAKGFAGEAYFGHFFWDTEIYLLPYFLYTKPEYARKLVGFRVNTIGGARSNAKQLGYNGAKYPWESSVAGTEQCPNWQYCDHEIHINSDVAHGIWHYYKATDDKEFLETAMPVLADIARYWQSRCHWDSANIAHINGVMGPDEYICLSNDNAYTNFMASKSLNFAINAAKLLGSKELTTTEQIEMVRLADALAIHRNKDGIVQQCIGFEELFESANFDEIWPERKGHFGAVVSQERNYRTKALKQADVLMLPYLYPQCMSADELAKSYDYYYPMTTHDSSLSYIVHAILKARMGQAEEAYSLFEKSMLLDMDKGAAEGIHIANCGGLWQGIVIGFCGMNWSYESSQPEFNPHLPTNWKSVSFPLVWKNKKFDIKITNKQVIIKVDNDCK